MAKPIELALSKVWRLPAVKRLNVSQVGAFLLLAREAIYDGLDPFTAPRLALQNSCRCNPQQWPRVWQGLRPALEGALPILRAEYEQRRRTRKINADNCKVMLAKYRDARHFESVRKQQEGQALKRLVDAPDPAFGAMQPTKAPIYRPANIDYQARQKAMTKIKSAPLVGPVLRD